MTTYRKKKRVQPAWNQILRIKTLGTLPPRARLKMQYTNLAVLGDSTAISDNWVYRLNSVWDPDYTGTGVTVTGYSTFSSLYSRYFVHESEVKVTMSIRDTTAVTTDAINQICGCVITDFIPASPTTAGYDSEELIEKYRIQNTVRGTASGGIYRLNYIKCAGNTGGTGYPSSGSATLYGNRKNPGVFFFKDKRKYKMGEPLAMAIAGAQIMHPYNQEFPLSSAVGENPLDCIYLSVFGIALGQDDTAQKPLRMTYVTTTITYDVEWYAPNKGVPTYDTATAAAGTTIDVAETKLA